MGALQAKAYCNEAQIQIKITGPDTENKGPRRISDFFEALSLAQIPNDIINGCQFNHLNDGLSLCKEPDELMSSQDSKSSRNSMSLEHTLKDCFGNMNCITDLCPRFSYQIDKFSNKFNNGEGNFVEILEADFEACEVPEECNEMEL
ncbi:unnamed protein product [Blepharisma stoltei]|uniref:Uncharacterized protein n=1 Tax=Blepharisma stoltei TaxID=1481888 RepID=A0AAU9JQC6_9CILI|nr:unnamed protein product [Blepharisma stoltei]